MSKAVNVSVKARQNETSESVIRRFCRACKKERIVNEYLERTRYYKTPSQRRREEKHRATRRAQKAREQGK